MSCKQRGCLNPAQAVLPNRVSNEPGIGEEMEEEMWVYTCWGAHPWEMLCQMVGYRALRGVWRVWARQGTLCSQIFLCWTSP